MNHCLKHHARQKPESVPYDDLPLAAADTDAPERSAARKELAQTLETALGTLTEEHRQIVVLHELHGLTYTECATALGVPVGTVKSRLFHAFRKLRVQLEGYVHA
jgi:RNA polymerase sigma-70 factor (ECF subfamily)